jgi:hypothetical protein
VCAGLEAPTPLVEEEPMATMTSVLPEPMAPAVFGSPTVKRVISRGAVQLDAACETSMNATTSSKSVTVENTAHRGTLIGRCQGWSQLSRQ